MHAPVNPSFTCTCIKVGFKGSKLYRYIFVMMACHCLFVKCILCGAPEILCFVILTFPGKLHVYFNVLLVYFAFFFSKKCKKCWRDLDYSIGANIMIFKQ